MRVPTQRTIESTQLSDSSSFTVYPVRRQAERVIERHFDSAGRLRSERVSEYLGHEWRAAESYVDHDDPPVGEVDAGSVGCLSALIGGLLCAALFIGLAVIGAILREWVDGHTGATVGAIAALTLGLWWLQSAPSRSS
jgi:hypothetical protein